MGQGEAVVLLAGLEQHQADVALGEPSQRFGVRLSGVYGVGDSLRDLQAIATMGGRPILVLTGKGDLRRVSLDPSLVVADEREVLEDLLVAAHADAKQKVEAVMAEEMQKATGGLNLPGGLPGGLKLPF